MFQKGSVHPVSCVLHLREGCEIDFSKFAYLMPEGGVGISANYQVIKLFCRSGNFSNDPRLSNDWGCRRRQWKNERKMGRLRPKGELSYSKAAMQPLSREKHTPTFSVTRGDLSLGSDKHEGNCLTDMQ